MDIQFLNAPEDAVNFTFFTFVTTEGEMVYKGAVAEEVFGDGEVTGAYKVLVQSESRTDCFSIWKEEKGWLASVQIINEAVFNRIVSVIEKHREDEAKKYLN